MTTQTEALRRIAAYPFSRAEELSVEQMREIAREALAQPEQEQRCYCGDIYNLGVIHRKDGPCHYPENTSEYKRGYADAMNWKVQNHLEHLQPKVRTGDCLLTGVCASEGHKIAPQRTWVGLTDEEFELLNSCGDTDSYKFAKSIEAKLKEKNNA